MALGLNSLNFVFSFDSSPYNIIRAQIKTLIIINKAFCHR